MPEHAPEPRDGHATHRDGDRLLLATTRVALAPLAVATVATLATIAALLALPAVLAAAVDATLAGRGAGTAVAHLAAVIAVVTCADVLRVVAATFSTASATTFLRLRLTSHVLALGATGTRHLATGDLTTRLVGNTLTAGAAPRAILASVTGIATSAGGIVALFLIDWQVGVAFVVGLPVAAAAIRLFVTRMSDLYDDYQAAQGRLAAYLTDALEGARTVRASGTAEREIARVLTPLPALSRAGHALWRAQARGMWRFSLIMPLIEVAVLAVAGLGVSQGRLQPGQLLATAGYTALGLTFVNQIDGFMSIAYARSAARRICDVLALPAPVPGTRPLADGPGALSFRGVTVTRQDATILDDVDLEVPAGVLAAVVGPSGAGKTTLALLAGRLMDPDRGQVLLDGRRLDDIDPGSLREAVAYAFERPALLGDTVASTIAYGTPAARDAVHEAARAACVDDVVRRLPEGYDTPLGAAPLSGGEAQRLGLARALLRQARLTVLDDATSSLDTVTEDLVTRAFTERPAGRTRLVVAHRASTADSADLVIWLDKGRIRGRGTHRELSEHPDYRALFTDTLTEEGAPTAPAAGGDAQEGQS